jgi:hypothetical protein
MKVFCHQVETESSPQCYHDVNNGQKMLTSRVLAALDQLLRTKNQIVGIIRSRLKIDSRFRWKITELVWLLNRVT